MKALLKTIEKALRNIVGASSEIVVESEIHDVSRLFYFLCRKAKMKREIILRITSGIIDVLTEDMKTLEKNISEKKRRETSERY